MLFWVSLMATLKNWDSLLFHIFQIRGLLSESAEPFSTVVQLSVPGLADSRLKQLPTAIHTLSGLNTVSATHIVRGLLGQYSDSVLGMPMHQAVHCVSWGEFINLSLTAPVKMTQVSS